MQAEQDSDKNLWVFANSQKCPEKFNFKDSQTLKRGFQATILVQLRDKRLAKLRLLIEIIHWTNISVKIAKLAYP